MDKAKIQIIFTILTWLVVCSYKPCEAASIAWSGSASTTWIIGTKDGGTTWTSDGSPNTWTIKNDHTSSYENVAISVAVTSPADSTWAPCDGYGAPAASCYILKHQPSGTQLSSSAYLFATSLAPSGTSGFGLSFQCPLTAEGGIQHTLTVTLTASRACGGTLTSDEHCWYSDYMKSCTTICSAYGGCIAADADTPAEQLNGLKTICPGGPWLAYATGLASKCPMRSNQGCYYNPETTVYFSAGVTPAYSDHRRACPCAY